MAKLNKLISHNVSDSRTSTPATPFVCTLGRRSITNNATPHHPVCHWEKCQAIIPRIAECPQQYIVQSKSQRQVTENLVEFQQFLKTK